MCFIMSTCSQTSLYFTFPCACWNLDLLEKACFENMKLRWRKLRGPWVQILSLCNVLVFRYWLCQWKLPCVTCIPPSLSGFMVIFRKDLLDGSKDWCRGGIAIDTVSGKPQEHCYKVPYKSHTEVQWRSLSRFSCVWVAGDFWAKQADILGKENNILVIIKGTQVMPLRILNKKNCS